MELNKLNEIVELRDKREELTSLLNKLNGAYRAHEPEDEWDMDCMDEDYFYYKKMEPTTPVEVIKHRTKYGRK